MTRIWAFDNRTGAVNEQVTLGNRRRTPAPSGLEAWTRHPRITVAPGVKASAPTPPATTWGRIDHRGIRVPTDQELEALDAAYGHPADAYRAALAQGLEPAQTGGVYEALIRWEREHARA